MHELSELQQNNWETDTGIRIGSKVIKCINPLKTWFGNSEDPDVMQLLSRFTRVNTVD